MPIITYELRDLNTGDKTTVPCTIDMGNGQIWIRPHGYGEASSQDGHGFPIQIEYYDKSVRVVVWGDINSSDPTVNVKLDGALESKRLVDTN